jgi:hypothetical protein
MCLFSIKNESERLSTAKTYDMSGTMQDIVFKIFNGPNTQIRQSHTISKRILSFALSSLHMFTFKYSNAGQ